MKIFSKHRRKLEPHRRFGGREFRSRLRQAQNYKRSLAPVRYFLFRFRFLKWLLIVLALIIVYYLVVSSRFVITEVAVAGNSQVTQGQIQQALEAIGNNRLLLVKKNHYLLLTRGRVNKMLTNALPEIQEVVKSDRIGFRRIEIEIKERVPGFVLAVKDRKFLVDESGTVIRETVENHGLPEVALQTEEDVVVGEYLSNTKLTAFILSMHKSWPSKIATRVNSIKLTSKYANEVQFISAEEWSAFFDVNRSVYSQLSGLSMLLSKQIPAKDRARLAYVDMRSEKWVYYCFKSTPCAQIPAAAEGEQK
ncbi:MAG: hypothetical protein A3E98_00225 [Candidatus Doudnabacteria bacterium RIFCSPHIGHO2_12_FULL_48_11]|uniref:POTRA domain-containing protein n=1 Tax=Candidatus Doudnabacteria bacterium RIFCSPHIGHO2_01_FULL_46_24 TaxID=1817825 RepID=A0A1F5NV44_9BACT|nr:MAG: hypothetical protein A2720_02580 [Candidatus Doudnabacteria bacterium RIFCSPHIGHO2_01_FULL_46_24]OGE94236.1 MAG: hypothetical protein A3E98_00225 [Candidatus Doudnabacteria bacterium RIFCSPHIGHO2_12_FULL_48_11]